jgi:nicotinate dehydrogenase subunit B
MALSVIRFPNVPEIEMVLMARPEMPAGGGGEASSVPVDVAIGNAIFDATGVRIREAPFKPARILAGLNYPVAS